MLVGNINNNRETSKATRNVHTVSEQNDQALQEGGSLTPPKGTILAMEAYVHRLQRQANRLIAEAFHGVLHLSHDVSCFVLCVLLQEDEVCYL